MPLNPAFSADDGALTLVRDGCGRGFRFSNYRQACVPIEGYGGGGYGGGNYRGGGGGGGQRMGGGGGGGPRVGAGGGGNRSQGFAGPPQNWKKPGTGIR